MKKQEESCVYKTQVRIGNKKWQWCSFYKARIQDVDCRDCEIGAWKNNEKTLHPKTELLLV